MSIGDLLTVAIFSHERLSGLEIAVQSALDAFDDCEIWVIDDASASPATVKGLRALAQHDRVNVHWRRSPLRTWNQRGGFYSNIRFALKTVRTPFALLMEDDQQLIREISLPEVQRVTECLLAMQSPFMGVTFAPRKDAYLPAEGVSSPDIFVKDVQVAYTANALVHLARIEEHGFRIGPSSTVTDLAAARYFGAQPVWPTPMLAYRPSNYGFRFGRPLGEPQTTEEAKETSFRQLSPGEVVRLESMYPEVPTVAEFLTTYGAVEILTGHSLRGAKGKKPVIRRLWYFLTTRTYLLTMRIKHSLRRKVVNGRTVLALSKASHARDPDAS